MDIDIFANVDDYMNASLDDDTFQNMPPPSSAAAHIPSDVGTPETPLGKRPSKKSTAAAAKLSKHKLPVNVDDDDDDDVDSELDSSAGGTRRFTPGRGQKTAVQRFTRLKDNLQKIVRHGDEAQKAQTEMNRVKSQVQHFQSTLRETLATREMLIAASAAPAAADGVIDLSDDEDNGNGDGKSGKRRSNVSVSSLDDPFEEENYTVQVKVKWLSEPLELVPLRRYQPLSDLCAELASRHGDVPLAEIVLMLNERIVRHDETLDSIGYTIGKYLSARQIASDVLRKITKNAKTQSAAPLSTTAIELRIQSSLWKRPLTLSMEPTKRMMVLVILCAQHLKCPPGRLRLRFDGEALDLNATAEELELEGGEVMDLWMADE